MKITATYRLLNALFVTVAVGLLTVFPAGELVAQDLHFSQFYFSPLNLNPGATGVFDGDYRLSGNHRQQWRSVTAPFTTFGMSADAHEVLKVKNVGAGLSVFTDKAGDSQFSTLQVNMAGSYSIRIAGDAKHLLTIGLQSGFTQRSINTGNLTFDNQFNGSRYDGSLGSGESFANTGRLYPNLNAGIHWSKEITPRKQFSGGIALHNLTKPPQSFFGDDNIRLDRRLTLHGQTTHRLTDDLDLVPAVLFMGQGQYREFDLGSSLKYYLNKSSFNYRAVYIGGWMRWKDAGFITVGVDYDDLKVGVSYDINYSPLNRASRYRGGLEVSFIYLLRTRLPDRARFK